ncbi:MAG: glycosyltransferase family 39 protein [Candidatus Doudnabacteria bacterium]
MNLNFKKIWNILLISLVVIILLTLTLTFKGTPDIQNIVSQSSLIRAKQTQDSNNPETGGAVKSVIDGSPETWWYGKVTPDEPNLIEINWPVAHKISKIDLSFTKTRVAQNYKIQAADGDQWKNNLEVKNNKSDYKVHLFALHPIQTDKIRLWIQKTESSDKLQQINEIYIYEATSPWGTISILLSRLLKLFLPLLFIFILVTIYLVPQKQMRGYLCIILGIALTINTLWVFILPMKPISDAASYVNYARSIAYDHTYSGYGVIHSMYRPVGYPLFLASVFMFSRDNYQLVRVLQIIVGAINVLLVYLIAKQYFKQKVALAGSLIYAIYLENIFYISTLLTEVLFVFFLLFFILFLLYQIKKPAATHGFWRSGKIYWRYIIPAGFFWGIATLIRPAFFFLPLVIFFSYLFYQKHLVRSLKITFFVSLFGLLLIAPWTIRNYLVSGQIVLVSTSGINVILGNNPWSQGIGNWPTEEYLQEAGITKELRYPTSPQAEALSDKIYLKLGIKHIFNHPQQFIEVGIKKIEILFKPSVDIPTRSDLGKLSEEYFRYIIYLAQKLYLFVLVTGSLGLVFNLFAKNNLFAIFSLNLILLYLATIIILGFGDARFRYPLIPLFTIFSAYFISRISLGIAKKLHSFTTYGEL